jgi:hypothetical protein
MRDHCTTGKGPHSIGRRLCGLQIQNDDFEGRKVFSLTGFEPRIV